MGVRSITVRRVFAALMPPAFAKALAAVAILASLAAPLFAQSPFGSAGPAARHLPATQGAPNSASNVPGGPVQALYLSPGNGSLFGGPQSPYVDAHGDPIVVPVNYGEPCPGGDLSGYPCPPGGYGGTYPPVGYDLSNDVGIDGYAVDQRGPHYFDVRAEYVLLTREDSFRQQVDFTSLNITDANIVLSSDQLDIDDASGFRIIGRCDICPLSVLEFGYMGIFEWQAGASFTDPAPVDADTGNLYSLFSNFGTFPAGVTVQGGPMPESERSITQSIFLDVDLHTAEINYRRYWVGFIPRISGTFLTGFRYTRLREEFLFSTRGEAALDYSMDADNHLAGFQAGGDIWVSLLQGLRVGAEGKVGLYNNHYNLFTVIASTPPVGGPPDLIESFSDNQAALISEASADIVADILPSWSVRAGYEVLFLNSVVLAGENFNTGSPFDEPGQVARVPFLMDQGDVLMHGFHVGMEYIW
jgi:hypothetical protein